MLIVNLATSLSSTVKNVMKFHKLLIYTIKNFMKLNVLLSYTI